MRVKGQKGHNDATSILFMSALHRRVDFDRYLSQGRTIKLFREEELDVVCTDDNDLYLYYVKSGAIEVGLARQNERLTVLFVRGEGDAVVAGLPDCATFGGSRLIFRAARNTVLVGFTQAQVRAFMRDDDEFFDDMMYATHMAMAQMAHRIDNISHQSSSRRMLLWLEKLCEANTPDVNGVYRIPCNLTVDEMAGVLEVHYTTCNKLLKALKDRSILHKTRTHLEVHDRAGLQELLLEENPVLY